MVQKETLSSLTHGNFAKELSISQGKVPPNAVEFEKLPELVKTQVEAVKNIKIDKVTVWDSGNNPDGNTSTANFVSGMMKTVPPLNDLFNMAGLNLPEYLKGKSEIPHQEPKTKNEEIIIENNEPEEEL